jgi:ATP phosphoribosyltransferase regulatory subunit
MIDYDKVLRNDERAIMKLRQLFGRYGYQRFKTGKFEDYELYARNKDFLGNDGILTFTDSKGKLIALKPDVTLSIAKNAEVVPGEVQKFCYDDEVYRLSKWSGAFREIPQTGIECIGDIGGYDVCEVIILAVRSLELIDENYVLDLSHMGIVRGMTALLNLSPEAEEKVLQCIGEKNIHGALEICEEHGVPDKMLRRLKDLISIYGPIDEMVGRLNQLAVNNTMKRAIDELKVVVSALKAQGLEKNVRFDFSAVNDMGYYNGVIFQGFVEGIAQAILSGGRYDNLMWKMGHLNAGAIGFSISMGELTELNRQRKDVDVDVVILDHPWEDLETLNRVVRKYTDEGYSVSVQKRVPKSLRYGKLVQIENGEVKTVEADN